MSLLYYYDFFLKYSHTYTKEKAMGSSQTKVEEERQQKEAEQREQQRRAQEEERRLVQQKQEQQRKEEEQRKRRLEEEELEQRRRVEQEKENKLLEYKHVEEMQRIKDLEQKNQRQDTTNEKNYQLEHERLMQGQDKMFEILKDTFGKVKDVDINQAVYSAYIMQCIHSGNPIDKVVLEAVASKVPTPPPANLDQIVENVMQKCDEGEYESYAGNRSSEVVSPVNRS